MLKDAPLGMCVPLGAAVNLASRSCGHKMLEHGVEDLKSHGLMARGELEVAHSEARANHSPWRSSPHLGSGSTLPANSPAKNAPPYYGGAEYASLALAAGT